MLHGIEVYKPKMKHQCPSILYKYMPAGFGDGVILPYFDNGYIRFTQPGALNDPFEMEGAYSETDLETGLFNMQKMHVGAAVKNKNSHCQTSQLVRAYNKLKEDARTSPDGLNADIWSRIKARNNETYGILSLSECWNNSAMWSHYSNRHTGVCLGFDTNTQTLQGKLCNGMRSVQKVIYSTERVPLNLIALNKEDVNTVFYRKSIDWQYEKEWRCIALLRLLESGCFRTGPKVAEHKLVLVYLDPLSVREIHIGALSSKEVENKAREFAIAKNLRLFRTKLSQRTFEMDREELVL